MFTLFFLHIFPYMILHSLFLVTCSISLLFAFSFWTYSFLTIFCSLQSAVTIAVAAIKWLVSNGVVLAMGAIVTFGFCKLTGKCELVENFIPVAHLRNLVTPERLESAEEFLVKAVKRYTQETKSNNWMYLVFICDCI